MVKFAGHDTLEELIDSRAVELKIDQEKARPAKDICLAPVNWEQELRRGIAATGYSQVIKEIMDNPRLNHLFPADPERAARHKRISSPDRYLGEEDIKMLSPVFLVYKKKFPLIRKGEISLKEKISMEDMLVYYPKEAWHAAKRYKIPLTEMDLSYGDELRSAVLVVSAKDKPVLLDEPLFTDDGLYVLWERSSRQEARISLSKLGEGGLGEVFRYVNIFEEEIKADQQGNISSQPRCRVVKKILPEHLGTDLELLIRKSFYVEDKMARQIDPRLKNLAGSRFVDKKKEMVVSELLDNDFSSYFNLLKKNYQGDFDAAFHAVADQLLRLQASLMISGIAHSDIKSNNIMGKGDEQAPSFGGFNRPRELPEQVWKYLQQEPIYKQGCLKLFDFGISRIVSETKHTEISPSINFTPGSIDEDFINNGFYPNYSTDTYAFGIILRNIFKEELDSYFTRADNFFISSEQRKIRDHINKLDPDYNYFVKTTFLKDIEKSIGPNRSKLAVVQDMRRSIENLDKYNRQWISLFEQAISERMVEADLHIPQLIYYFTCSPGDRFINNKLTTSIVIQHLEDKRRSIYKRFR